jgi:hypothetical protein
VINIDCRINHLDVFRRPQLRVLTERKTAVTKGKYRKIRLAYKNRKRIAPFYIKNEHGVPDVALPLHWDPVWAQAIGNPMACDYGVMRENYLYPYLTGCAATTALCST